MKAKTGLGVKEHTAGRAYPGGGGLIQFRCSFLWRRRQAVKSPPFHGGIAGSNPAGVTNSLLTFYLSLHYGWRLTLKSQYGSLLEQMKKHYWGRTNMTYKWEIAKFVSH